MDRDVIRLDFSEEAYAERLLLMEERLCLMDPEGLPSGFCDYFKALRDFALEALSLFHGTEPGADLNQRLYADLSRERYPESFADPAYAVRRLSEGYGELLSAFYAEFRGLIVFCHEKNKKNSAIILETLIQLFNEFEENREKNKIPDLKILKDLFYSYVYDYCGEFTEDYVRAGLLPGNSLPERVMETADLQDPADVSWLYVYGEWITEEELETARLMARLSEAEIEAMAAAYTEGYFNGFARAGKSLSQKHTVLCDLPLGFERFMKKAAEQFRSAGLTPVFRREPKQLALRTSCGNVRPGFFGAQNPQYEYDHREDLSLIMGDRYRAEKLKAVQHAYGMLREAAAAYSGRACVETFGEAGAAPLEKAERLRFTKRQQRLMTELRQKQSEILEAFLPEGETSFTIISWPRPEIASAHPGFYGEIFRDIIKINTLPEERYRKIQQRLIDALDQADRVEIRGGNGNRTQLTVRLQSLGNPEQESRFENCLADVNVPLGEVFTTPELSGTEGELYVSEVYLSGCRFEELWIRFSAGRVVDYGCKAETKELGRARMEELIFQHQEALPMGEFAIGTNTTAYRAAEKWGIGAKLPVLIAEKTGPHFAVGDTCYAHEEEFLTYNPDGKAIVARENECSRKRKTDPEHAYFHVHVDITIPYEEIGLIRAAGRDHETDILREGRFVLPGTEELNEALESRP